MRFAVALAASAALHLAVVAIPGLEPRSGSVSSDAVERISVALPQSGDRQKEPDRTSQPAPPAGGDAPAAQASDAGEDRWFGIPLPYYYEPKELTERASPVTDVVLDSPSVEAYPGAGKIVLLLYINEEGKVDDVTVLSSDIDSPAVETAVVEQFQMVRFAAGKLNGQPVKSKKKIEVVIKPPLVIKPGAVPSLPMPAKGN